MILEYGFWKGDPDKIWCLKVTIRLPGSVSDIKKCFFSQKCRHNVNSAKGRCNLLEYENSEKVTPALCFYSVVTVHISYTVSDIIRFCGWQEMTF